MESQSEDTSQPSVRESNNVTESNTGIEMSKDISDRVEIEKTSEDNSKRERKAWNHFKRVKVEAPRTVEVLVDTLVEALMDWNIDRKVSTITIDNCTTNDAMINHLLQKLPTKDMPLDGKVLHMCCCAHILNLIVKDGLDIISSSIERIRDSVIYWTASPSRVEKFEETARQVPVNCSKKLCLDCKIRWNSTYLMLETAIIYKDVFPHLNVREKNYKSLPAEEDWVNAIEICGKLKLFHQVTEMFSGTLYPTSNFYFQKICDIKVKLDEWVKSPNTLIQDMALSMLRNDKYWEVCHILMGVAVVLDPRYKMSLVEFFFRKIYHESARFKIDEVRQNCYDLLFDYQSKCCTLNESSSSIGSLENTMSSDVHSNVNVDDSLDEFEQFVVSKTFGATNLSATSVLDMYLKESLLPRGRDFDILNWWKTNGVKFPTLQKMARDILAIHVYTVASESAFSSSGKLINPHRNRFHHTTVEALMCSHRWLWNETNDSCSTSDGIKTCPSILDEEDGQDDRDSK
ncbi:UNVERIFIED_CONTAM: putative AC transposase [Sesamum angustifolium]|uniref:AC transposase n=1 Tax=Sesamum angustifolium TaxID=2727405 RepID=A0AAW2RM67_9LAMI